MRLEEIKKARQEVIERQKKSEEERENALRSRSEGRRLLREKDLEKEKENRKIRESLEAKVKSDYDRFDKQYSQRVKEQEKLREERRKNAEAWRQSKELLSRKISESREKNKEFDEVFSKLEQERFWKERSIRYSRQVVEKITL